MARLSCRREGIQSGVQQFCPAGEIPGRPATVQGPQQTQEVTLAVTRRQFGNTSRQFYCGLDMFPQIVPSSCQRLGMRSALTRTDVGMDNPLRDTDPLVTGHIESDRASLGI
jgi:hypothetical protein